MVAKNQFYHISLALLFCMGFLAFQVSCRSLQDATMYERHEEWMARYGKWYKDPQEREKRFRIFKENVNYIEAFNSAANKPYKLAINQFADLTNEEFIASRNRFKGHMCSSIIRSTTFKYENVTAVPSTVDWRQKGAVTPVKDQGQCEWGEEGYIRMQRGVAAQEGLCGIAMMASYPTA
ncbi:Senescence-specific cysteine protease [Vigna angularis]|uniref:Senescence-specific cysteine protease n=1 Tax=Phaseolus angularis TaxID=3914 RepID=A0A8T0KBX7_PHAAN|nr:Senescence-specific cysteine protease [Vigna angularis]